METWYRRFKGLPPYVLLTISIASVVLFYYQSVETSKTSVKLVTDVTKQEECRFNFLIENLECTPICRTKGYFGLPGMAKCHKLLDCKAMKKEVKKGEFVNSNGVKAVSIGKWKIYDVMMVKPKNSDESKQVNKFRKNLDILTYLNPNPGIVKLLGSCGTTYVTQHHPLGTLFAVEDIFEELLKYNTLDVRLSLCVSYIRVIENLHKHVPGPIVFCDSHGINKYLKKFKVTNNMEVVITDVNKMTIFRRTIQSCSKKGKKDWIPPEEMKPNRTITEKKDIWRIPKVVKHILGREAYSIIKPYIVDFNKRCMTEDPLLRPSATEVLNFYQNLSTFLPSQ